MAEQLATMRVDYADRRARRRRSRPHLARATGAVARRGRAPTEWRSPTRWCWPPRARTAGRPRARCCARASTPAASCSTRTTPRPRATTCAPPGTPRPPSPGTPSTGRCTCVATVELVAARGDAGVLGHPPARFPARRVGVGRSPRWCATGVSSTTRWPPPPGGSPTRSEVPAPPHWGGWRILPEQVEFWQGRAQPDARPAALRARHPRPHLARPPPRPLSRDRPGWFVRFGREAGHSAW